MDVLIVDDSPIMRRYVARVLEMTNLGITTHEAENGCDGIDKAIRIHPDLIITDLNMPVMNGEELLGRVFDAPELKGTPVIVLSADRSVCRSEGMRRSGAVAYLTKPVTPESLRREIVTLMEEAH